MAGSRQTPKSQPRNKGGHRRKRMALMILAGVLTWAGITYWDQAGKSRAKAEELAALSSKLAEVQKVNDQAKQQVARLNDDEYIEQMIRSELHYAKPGETIFYVPK